MADPTASGSQPAATETTQTGSQIGATADPATQVESVDLSAIGFQGKSLPKPFVEKILGYKPEHLEYLSKLDVEDREAYDKSVESWNIRHNNINKQTATERDSYKAKLSELDDREAQIQARYKELEEAGANSAYFKLDPENRKTIDTYKRWLDAGEIDEKKFELMTKPIFDSLRMREKMQMDQEAANRKTIEAKIDELAEKNLTAKYGVDSATFSGYIGSHMVLNGLSPEDAAVEVDKVASTLFDAGYQKGKKEALSGKIEAPGATETAPKPAQVTSNTPDEYQKKVAFGERLAKTMGFK